MQNHTNHLKSQLTTFLDSLLEMEVDLVDRVNKADDALALLKQWQQQVLHAQQRDVVRFTHEVKEAWEGFKAYLEASNVAGVKSLRVSRMPTKVKDDDGAPKLDFKELSKYDTHHDFCLLRIDMTLVPSRR